LLDWFDDTKKKERKFIGRGGEEIRILGFEYGFLNSFDEVGRYNVLDEIFSNSFLGVFRDDKVGAS
jgi:hypothetical protein